jgi:hypothetical protein
MAAGPFNETARIHGPRRLGYDLTTTQEKQRWNPAHTELGGKDSGMRRLEFD